MLMLRNGRRTGTRTSPNPPTRSRVLNTCWPEARTGAPLTLTLLRAHPSRKGPTGSFCGPSTSNNWLICAIETEDWNLDHVGWHALLPPHDQPASTRQHDGV